MTDKKVIVTKGLGKIFKVGLFKKPTVALQNLDLEVYEKEVFGFLGANGAGKTTTIKLLMGLIFPTSGEVKVLNCSVQEKEHRRKIGFLPEQAYFYDYLTGGEFLTYYGQLFGIEKNKLLERIKYLLDMVGIPSVFDLQLRKFSKGMLQRIGIAQALLNDPELLILDEPLAGLDPLGRRDIRELIRKISEEGKTVFFSSHILHDVEMLCNRVGFLKDGKLEWCGNVKTLLEHENRSVEIQIRGMDKAATFNDMKIGRSMFGEITILKVDDEKDVDNVIEVARASGGKIISVIPVKENLESLFFKE